MKLVFSAYVVLILCSCDGDVAPFIREMKSEDIRNISIIKMKEPKQAYAVPSYRFSKFCKQIKSSRRVDYKGVTPQLHDKFCLIRLRSLGNEYKEL